MNLTNAQHKMQASGRLRNEDAYCDIAPAGVIVQAEVDIILERQGEPVHEGGAWRDGVAVPCLALVRLWHLDTLQNTHPPILGLTWPFKA